MISVREVITLAAKALGRDDLCGAINEAGSQPSGEVASLLHCFNMIENEIALDYFPLKHTETFSTVDNGVLYQSFSKSPISIISVRSETGEELSYELRADKLVLSAFAARVVITYCYIPQSKTLQSVSDFTVKVSPRLMAYGVACEFCLTTGKFQEAAMWESKYKDALRAANILRRTLRTRSRRWV
ncbi:MAG: hypothetical protein K2N74_00910 [Clostridiales bacterium]|nr:hypothetical protein [Clostridiales bacterium]